MSSSQDPKFKIKPYQQMTAAVTGAITTSLFMTPLDVVKTRIQAQQKLMLSNKCFLYCNGLMDHLCPCGPDMSNFKKTIHLNGTIDGLIKITRSEGLSALWSGLGPTLISALPSTVIYFVAYEQFKEFYMNLYKKYINNQLIDLRIPVYIPLISGASARVLAVTCVCPLELIRTKMQSEKLSYMQMNQALKSVIKIDGIFGLWTGLKPTIYRDVPFSAIYWTCYETIKAQFNVSEPTFGFSFFAGATAGSISAFITTPFDVIKTHQQIELGEKVFYTDKPAKSMKVSKSMANSIKELYISNGFSGLFAGLSPRIFKVAPACAIMIATFEYGKSFFYKYNKQHHNASSFDVINN
ncbi:probable mitochondrial glutathione transporter SLC25A40 [Condylostylus longicornis]|uniref:probable mitochondrial glutathione transporter SLC25A40 n=1 Tax=Condylostylus longicornis TaxID=2530218 RepID=UPI00244E2E82|nr:probable mitochondrial glutathione transporter SLC25A40 [Condylostylus longicornis]